MPREIPKTVIVGSIGNCSKCHLRREFFLAQVRKPEVCGQYHLGPDHPQDEIYKESAHGVCMQPREKAGIGIKSRDG